MSKFLIITLFFFTSCYGFIDRDNEIIRKQVTANSANNGDSSTDSTSSSGSESTSSSGDGLTTEITSTFVETYAERGFHCDLNADGVVDSGETIDFPDHSFVFVVNFGASIILSLPHLMTNKSNFYVDWEMVIVLRLLVVPLGPIWTIYMMKLVKTIL